MNRIVEHDGAVLEFKLYCCRPGEKIVEVFRKSGPWLDDDDLIMLADGGQPQGSFFGNAVESMNKGGAVMDGHGDDHKIVTVKV